MLDEYYRKIERIKAIDIQAIFMRVMANPAMQEQLIEYNKVQLNEEGVFADGKATGGYSEAYAKVREAWGLQTDHKDLNFTGAMQESMVVREGSGGVVISADTEKGAYNLIDTYPCLLGLTPDSINAIRPLFNELFWKEYMQEINAIRYGN